MIQNVVTIDVEDYFNVTNLRCILPETKWPVCPSYVERDTGRILEILDWRNTKATFFVLGWIGERFPQLVRQIHRRGHEIACHSYRHDLVYDLDQEGFYEDTRRAKEILEDIIGESVRGYRAPSFSIVPDCQWAYRILMELGFQYSSSTHPIRHDRYGNPNGRTMPYIIFSRDRCQSLLEIPVSTFQLGRQNVPFSGGGYLRLIPYQLVAKAIHKKNSDGDVVVIYLHPWEVNPDQPRFPIKLVNKFRHYVNLATTDRKFWRLIDEFPCRCMSSYVHELLDERHEPEVEKTVISA
jgi:polysaccharide deacetylase family protein (PEP-CTERM system associated)